jgi:ketosteroid isomerase-like protein
VFAVVHQRLRGRSSGIEVDGIYGIVYELSDGRVTALRSYPDVAEAMADTGIDD